jgi:hypothetical protein
LKDSSKVVGIHKAYDAKKFLNFATMITEEVIAVLESWALEMGVSFENLNSN